MEPLLLDGTFDTLRWEGHGYLLLSTDWPTREF